MIESDSRHEQIAKLAEYRRLSHVDQMDRIKQHALLFSDPESLFRYLDTHSQAAQIAFFCLGGAIRSPELKRKLDYQKTAGRLTSYMAVEPGYAPVIDVLAILERMEAKVPNGYKVIVVAYDQNVGEPTTVINQLLTERLKATPMLSTLEPAEVMDGDLSSINARLLLVEMES